MSHALGNMMNVVVHKNGQGVQMSEHTEQNTSVRLASRLRTARLVQRMNMRDLAARAEVSASVISDIENRKTNVSIATVAKLCSALDLLVADLFSDELLRMHPMTGEHRASLKASDGVTKSVLIKNKRKGLSQYELTIEPGGTTGAGNVHPGSDEYIYVVRNEAVVRLGDSEIKLRETDSLEYRSELEHEILNSTNQPSVLIWTIATDGRTESRSAIRDGDNKM